MPELSSRNDADPRNMHADAVGPESAERRRPNWKPPEFREFDGHFEEPGPRSPTGSLIEGRMEELRAQTVTHRAQPTEHSLVPNSFGKEEFPADPDDVGEQFIRALACWRATEDFQDWLESGRYERGRSDSAPQPRVFDLNDEEYFER
ncbi:hypothetical protein [Methylobacterium brachiatum]|jgi:hypothetical protein|uniref:hypothetical protein n=1 Tax=Methylobacterium brachiatum TaxID=269660 RepID=UPI002449EE31|nr:hypothetical protein [Methylobacterium brachiatum]MDH2312338.1 hypothetical protein [Methylobacterium brachiatum]